MAEFDVDEFRRAYSLLALYAHQLIREQEYMPVELWQSQVKSDDFPQTLEELLDNGYVFGGEYEGVTGYSITEAGQALVWLYSDVMKDIWLKNLNGEGTQLIEFLVANLDAHAQEVREAQAQAAAVEEAEVEG